MTVFWADSGTYCMSFSVWSHVVTPLGGNFCQVVMVCPKCRQGANILGASLRDYQAALNYEVTTAAIKVLRKG